MNCVAVIQMASGPNVTPNLNEAGRLLDMAAGQGAKLAVLPENFAIMGMGQNDLVKAGEHLGRGPIQDFLARRAQELGLWIVGGTVPVLASPGKVHAVAMLFNPSGKVVAHYNKIHLFDVQIEETGEEYTESQTVEPGNSVVVVDTPFGRLGLAVCYDLRFPELFRSMLDAGVQLIAVPSAFTAITGKAHWEILVRARAIENLSYVLAAGQGGYHYNGRETFGDSMIVDPWGNVLNRHAKGNGVVCANVDIQYVERVRAQFPVVEHRRLRCAE
ncbi:MAG: carbon-nitrogen hydrolase family protein [Gammaproteobacteria bacterium]|nr:carbon-nitrogen hydrolase family protein [Gammaproteobacteria bacterium]